MNTDFDAEKYREMLHKEASEAWDKLEKKRLIDLHAKLRNINEQVKTGDRKSMLELIEITADTLLLFESLLPELRTNLANGLKETVSTEYCKSCATRILASWQGWPHKDAVPLLPRLVSGYCASCGGSEPLNSERIIWCNYHGPYSTGLPDYWLLKIEGEETHWGLPYYAEGVCPKCRTRTIISEMKYPNGRHELMHNCKICGLIKVRTNQTAGGM